MPKIRTVTAAVTLVTVGLLASACTGSPRAAGPRTHASAQHSQPDQTTPPASASAQPSPSPTGTPAAEPCATSALAVSLEGGSGTAGSSYKQLVFTNTGKATCTLDGFPGVSYVRHEDGAQVGAAADRVGQARTVSLAPGSRAVAPLQVTDVQNYPEDRCGQTTAHGLRVFPPNETTPLFVPDQAVACVKPSVHVLHVWSVRAAS